MTLVCVRRDKDNHTKTTSSLELHLDLISTKFDIDVQTSSYQYEDHDLCPMPQPTPYNPYNVAPVPCNFRNETRYNTTRTIHIRERTGRNATVPLNIDAPDERVTSLIFWRNLDFLSSDPVMYGFSSGGAQHVVEFSTHTTSIKAFVDRCSTPTEEQASLIKSIADKRAADEAAAKAREEQARIAQEQAEEQARIAAEKQAEQKASERAARIKMLKDKLVLLLAYIGQDANAWNPTEPYKSVSFKTNRDLSAPDFDDAHMLSPIAKTEGVDERIDYMFNLKFDKKIHIPSGTSCDVELEWIAPAVIVSGKKSLIVSCYIPKEFNSSLGLYIHEHFVVPVDALTLSQPSH